MGTWENDNKDYNLSHRKQTLVIRKLLFKFNFMWLICYILFLQQSDFFLHVIYSLLSATQTLRYNNKHLWYKQLLHEANLPLQIFRPKWTWWRVSEEKKTKLKLGMGINLTLKLDKRLWCLYDKFCLILLLHWFPPVGALLAQRVTGRSTSAINSPAVPAPSKQRNFRFSPPMLAWTYSWCYSPSLATSLGRTVCKSVWES